MRWDENAIAKHNITTSDGVAEFNSGVKLSVKPAKLIREMIKLNGEGENQEYIIITIIIIPKEYNLNQKQYKQNK